jgi:hypothetical protein
MRASKGRGMDRPSSLPDSLRGPCRQIAQEITEDSAVVRDEKILTARVRICSGYYDSEEVLRVIADRVLSEGHSQPPSN